MKILDKVYELKKILLEENEIYKKVLELSNKKTDCIASDNIEEIQKINLQEEELIQDAKKVEARRELVISKMEQELNIDKVDDITSLLDNIKNYDLKKELQGARNELVETLTQLKVTNELNNTLIKDALEYINLSLNLMTSATNEGMYGRNAQEPETQNRSFFDTKG